MSILLLLLFETLVILLLSDAFFLDVHVEK